MTTKEKSIDDVTSREEVKAYIRKFPVGAWFIDGAAPPPIPTPPEFFTDGDKKEFTRLAEEIRDSFDKILKDPSVRKIAESFLIAVVPKIISNLHETVELDKNRVDFLFNTLLKSVFLGEFVYCINGTKCITGSFFARKILPTSLDAPYSETDKEFLSRKRVRTSASVRKNSWEEKSALKTLSKEKVEEIKSLAREFATSTTKKGLPVLYLDVILNSSDIDAMFHSYKHKDKKYLKGLSKRAKEDYYNTYANNIPYYYSVLYIFVCFLSAALRTETNSTNST
jgi:hypothetical protein